MSPVLSVAAAYRPQFGKPSASRCFRDRSPSATWQTSVRSAESFIYQQGDKAQQALNETFAPSQADDDVLFHLPVTKNWLYQLILGLVLICHSSYRNVVECFAISSIRRSVSALSTIDFKPRLKKPLK
jgi:hypothetical protein